MTATMIPADLAARLAALEAENAALKAAKAKRLSLVRSPKGAVQLNGLRRFPTTLYADEWKQVLEMREAILAFIEANKSTLRTKGGDED